jgi:hypothetical protein
MRNSFSKHSVGASGGTISVQNSKIKNHGYHEDASDRVSNISQPLRGLGATITSASTVLEARRVLDNHSTTGNLKPEISSKLVTSHPRKTSAHSQGSNHSGGDPSIKGIKSKSKLVPISLASRSAGGKAESPKKKAQNGFIRKEPTITLNF